MRTTITLDAQAEKAITDLRRASGMGLSEAANNLIHRGAATRQPVDYAYPTIAVDMGARLAIDKTADVLDLLDEADR